MGFKSLFPFFNRTEVAPSEPDNNPDVDSKFTRSVARLEAASNILEVFKFLRADYNGRLHITSAPTDFENVQYRTTVTVIGNVVAAPANPDRQTIFLANNAAFDVGIYLVIDTVNVFFAGLLPGDVAQFSGFTQAIVISSTIAGGNILVFEM